MMSRECASRSKDAGTSCHHHEPHPNQVIVHNLRPPVKWHSDMWPGLSVQASGRYLNNVQQIVTELNGTASEDKVTVLNKIVMSIFPMKQTERILEFVGSYTESFNFPRNFWLCRHHSFLKLCMKVSSGRWSEL